jgi:hypothetical protein
MARIGGGNLLDLYRVHPDHTGIIAASGTPTTLIASPTSTDRAYRFGGATDGTKRFIVSSQWANGEGSATLPINTVNTETALWTFLRTAAPFSATATATEIEEQISEDGLYRIGGSSGSGTVPTYLAMHYGAAFDDNITVYAALVNLSVSGFPNQAANTFNQVQITLTTVAAKANFTVPNGLWDARVTAPGTAIVIPTSTYLYTTNLVTP